MKAIILSNQTRSMSIFWRVLIRAMAAKNMTVVCCAPGGDAMSDAELRALGCQVIHYKLDRKGLNPARDAASFLSLFKIFREQRPDILFATTIKPVIYGCLAAHLAGVPHIFATITGLGYAFEADTTFKKLINRVSRHLYRASLRHARGVFFQNRDDLEVFRQGGILMPDARVFMAAGTGVDTKHFAPAPFPPLPPDGPLVFLLVARLLQAKGLAEYAEAARTLKKKHPEARFQLLGPGEDGPGGVAMAQIEKWRAECGLEYLGECRDVRPFLAACHVAVLPSWREGVPTSLMEAMSMGRPCVATNAPGCREVVFDGRNGYLVNSRDPASLAEGMEKFLLSPRSAIAMGEKSRQLAVEKFDAARVAAGILGNMLQEPGR